MTLVPCDCLVARDGGLCSVHAISDHCKLCRSIYQHYDQFHHANLSGCEFELGYR